jgi:hypothetical protein
MLYSEQEKPRVASPSAAQASKLKVNPARAVAKRSPFRLSDLFSSQEASKRKNQTVAEARQKLQD